MEHVPSNSVETYKLWSDWLKSMQPIKNHLSTAGTILPAERAVIKAWPITEPMKLCWCKQVLHLNLSSTREKPDKSQKWGYTYLAQQCEKSLAYSHRMMEWPFSSESTAVDSSFATQPISAKPQQTPQGIPTRCKSSLVSLPSCSTAT